MTRSYILSKGAAADIQEIARYTLKQWGKTQCQTYIAELEAKADTLAIGEGIFKDMGIVLPGLRMAICGSHYIFCMPRQNAPAIILAILHERMDMLTRLKGRLT